jgi:hypothetical protein
VPVAAAALAAFAFGQWRPAVNDVRKVQDDPATEAAYYAPLNAFLAAHPGAYRTEIPFTRAHWEAAYVARHHALARGWQRQLDTVRNPLFYGDAPLTPATYERWLHDNAVRYVALPDATLDSSSDGERGLIEGRPPYLRPVWRSPHWRVFEVDHPAPLRVAWSPYWKATNACVERDGDWTRVTARRPGPIRLHIDFAPGRAFSHGARCG